MMHHIKYDFLEETMGQKMILAYLGVSGNGQGSKQLTETIEEMDNVL